MKLNQQQKEEIIQKNAMLENIKPILKEEFRGIDNVIDSIIENIRPFYIFPTSLKRPLVVNLWGLTGTGKTSVVNRIVELLNLKHKYCKFDVGEYVHASSEHKLKYDLSDKVEKCTDKHLILAFDEFQLGRTIGENGQEIDRPSLRPIWDVIDSGIINHFNRNSNYCAEIISKLKKCLDLGVVVENGVIVQNEEIYNSVFRSYYLRAVDFQNFPPFNKDDITENDVDGFDDEYIPTTSLKSREDNLKEDNLKENSSDRTLECIYMYKTRYNSAVSREEYSKPYFIKYDMFNRMFDTNPEFFMEVKDFEQWKHKFRDGQDGDMIIRTIMMEFIQKTPLMQAENYSQSLIFCIGNIDEAYNMTHSSDPDADADLFHEHSLKISVPKMKEALSTRFRMEQIGRLGNNHIIYPALNKQTYCEIIERYLKQRIEDFQNSFEINLIPDNSVKDILYKESVFPTQGARPILSTFNTLVDAYVAKLINDVIFTNPETETIEWTYESVDDKEFFFIFKTIAPNNVVEFKYPVKLTIENLRKSDFSEAQASCAVHEAGHAVVSIMKNKLMPQEVKSRTASIAEGFCYIQTPDITTKELLYGQIMVCLAGLEAEKLIFGEENMGVGGTSDLRKATEAATAMVKTYGMANFIHQISIEGCTANAIYNEKSNHEAEKWAIEIVQKAQEDTKQMLEDNKKFLLELAHHLSIYPAIAEEELTIMAEKYKPEIKNKNTYHGYKNTIKQKMMELNMKYNEIPEEIKTVG
jgi:cell division protease FtsH